MAAAPGAGEQVALKVCREGRVVSVQVPLAREDGLGTARIVHWAGAQLQVCFHSPLLQFVMPLCPSQACLLHVPAMHEVFSDPHLEVVW